MTTTATTTYSTSLRLPIYTNNGTLDVFDALATHVAMIEEAVAGVTTVTLTGGSVSASAGNGVADQSRPALLKFIGALTSNAVYVVPNVKKIISISNATSGSYTVSVKTASGSVFAVPQSNSQILYCDGAGSVIPLTPAASIAAGAIASGSIAAAGTSGNLQYNASGVFGGVQAVNYATSGTLLTATAQALTDIPLAIVGAGSQSANLLEVRNSVNTILYSVSSVGNILTTGTLTVSGAATLSSTLSVATSTLTPITYGGNGIASTLTLQSTSGAGTTDAIIFKVGNAGAIEGARFNTVGQYVSALGTVGAPSIAPTGGLTTGLYFPSTASAAISVAGTQVLLAAAGAVTATGTVTGNSFIPSSATVPANGMYLSGANTLDFATASTNALRISSTQQIGIGGAPTTSWLHVLKAGTATIAPLTLTTGTNLTSAVAGTFEFDGVQQYQTIDTTSGRGAVPVEQYFHLTAAGGAISTIANFFGATSNISLVASAYYLIDIEMFFTVVTGTQTVTWTLTNSAAPTSQNIYFEMSPVTGVVAPPGTTTMLVGQFIADATAARTVVTAALSAATHYARFRIWLQNGTGTNLKIQATSSANTITPGVNSYWRARRVSPNNIGTFAA